MPRIAFGILLCVMLGALPSEVSAQSKDQPIAIRIHKLSSLSEQTNRSFEAAAYFLRDEVMIEAAKSGREQLANRRSQWEDPEGFDPVVGYVYTVDSSGTLQACSFRSVANHGQFRRFLDAEIQRRGDDTLIEGDENQVRVFNPDPPDPPPGRPKIRYVDSYYRFDNGIVFQGNQGNGLNSSVVVEAMRRAKDTDSYYELQPQRIGAGIRKRLLQRMTAAAYVQMQQRDGEPVPSFAARRTLQQNYVDLMSAILFETRSVTFWEKLPSAENPYQASLSLVPEDGSELQGFLDQLRPGAVRKPRMPNERMISLAVNFRLPDLLAPTAIAMVDTLPFAQSELGQVLKHTVVDGHLDFSAVADLRNDAGPILSASARVSRTDMSPKKIAESVGGGRVGEDWWSRTLRLTIMQESIPAVAALRLSNGQLNATLSRDLATETSKPVDKPSEQEEAEIRGTVFAIECDFTPREIDGSSMRDFIQELEKIWQRQMFYRMPEKQRRFRYANASPLNRFRSLIVDAPAEGDWRASSTLRVHQGAMSARVRVGRELYNFFLARDFVAKRSLFGN